VVNGATVLQPVSAGGPLLLKVSAPDGIALAHLVLGGTHLSFSLWSSDSAPPTLEPLDADAARARLGLPVATAAPTSAAPLAPTPTPAPVPTPPTRSTYTVQEGDTLESIAGRLGVDPGAVWWSNRTLLEAGPLAPGMQLVVPTINGFLYQVHAGDTWDSIAATFGLPSSLVEQLNQPALPASAQPSAGTLIFIPRLAQ
jgi:LysM repeat protein